MEVQNLSWKNKINRNNNPLLFKSIRGVIVGKSGCGETTLLCNLLLQPNWLDYNKLMVYGKSLDQPVYNIMRKAFELGLYKEKIVEIFKNSDTIINFGVNINHILKNYGISNDNINAEFVESSEKSLRP